jgi:hypothetical protein
VKHCSWQRNNNNGHGDGSIDVDGPTQLKKRALFFVLLPGLDFVYYDIFLFTHIQLEQTTYGGGLGRVLPPSIVV